jgi:iron complex outermembrane receptor protein
VAYELGYRIKPTTNLSFDAAGFFNDYDKLRSVEPLPGGKFKIENKLEGQSYGASLASKWQITDWWQVDGSVAVFHVDISRATGGQDVNNGTAESNDPQCTFVLHSAMDLPWHVRFDSFLRYVDDLPNSPHTPSYLTADVRLAWSPRRNCEIAIVGRNLFDNTHPEFATTTLTREVERSVYGTFKWSF